MYTIYTDLLISLHLLNNRIKNIDRGNLLKEIVESSGVSIVNLVKKVGYKDRASYYTHIAKPDLSLEILFAYAKVLKYDLRDEFPEVSQFLLEEPAAEYITKPETLDEAIVLIDKWKEKYYALLEKYSILLEKGKDWQMNKFCRRQV